MTLTTHASGSVRNGVGPGVNFKAGMKPGLLSFVLVVCGGTITVAASDPPRLVIVPSSAEIVLPIDMQVVDVAFLAKNTSGSTVRIRKIMTECDCIKASVEPSVIEPGNAGRITLEFRARVRQGTEVVRAEVITDGNEIYPVSVTAKLRSFIEVTPRTLLWKKGELRELREFAVSSTGLGKLRFTKVAAVKDVKVEISSGREPESIRVLVTPPAGDRPFQDILLVTAVLEATNESKVYDLHIRGD